MSHWESVGKSDEWYTPRYIFSALGEKFDLDVANGAEGTDFVPCYHRYGSKSLDLPWHGFVWMNPPFGARNSLTPWLDKFFSHGNGIALTPDRTSTGWWQQAAIRADAFLFVHGKIKFVRPDGTVGKSPSTGTTLFASGTRGVAALRRSNLGVVAIEMTDTE